MIIMLNRLPFTLIATTYLLSVMALPGASPQFKEAFEKSLIEIEHADFYKGTGNVLVEFEKLLKLGSREDIAQSVASLWADPARISSWSRAASLVGCLGPQFDRSSILKSVKKSLSYSFNAKAPEAATMASARFLCNYGTLEDVEQVKRFALEIKPRKPILSKQLEATLIGRENRIALERAVNAEREHDQSKVPTLPQSSPPLNATIPSTKSRAFETQPAPHSDKVTSSTPWTAVASAIIATIGLLWLLLKRRK